MVLHKRFSAIFFGLVLVFAGFLIASCAQKTTPDPALEEARSAIQAARTNPVVVKNAPLELQKAEEALNRGEELLEEGADQKDIEQQAYLARQHAAIAQQIGERKMAEETIKEASAERNRILLEARAAEAKYAQERVAGLEAELAELRAVKEERGMVVTLGDVVFDVGKAELKPGGLLVVDNLAEFMEKYPSRNVMIEGFTDSTGSADLNQALSERRAESVRDALVAKGIDPSRIETRGYGENFPVASNDTVAGRQLNRRVEIVISNGNGERIPERTG